MRRLSLVIATTLAAALAPMAHAQAAGELNEAHLAMLDQDGDGVVSRAEFDAYMDAAFGALDTVGDGALSADEFAVYAPVDTFAAIDADGDGMVSRDEFDAQTSADFAAADSDGDGALNGE